MSRKLALLVAVALVAVAALAGIQLYRAKHPPWVSGEGLAYLYEDDFLRLQAARHTSETLSITPGDYSLGYSQRSNPLLLAKLAWPPVLVNVQVYGCRKLPNELLGKSLITVVYERYGITNFGMTYYAREREEFPLTALLRIHDKKLHGFIAVERFQPAETGKLELVEEDISPTTLHDAETGRLLLPEERHAHYGKEACMSVYVNDSFPYYLLHEELSAYTAPLFLKHGFDLEMPQGYQPWYVIRNPFFTETN